MQFMENNQATAFKSHLDAKVCLNDNFYNLISAKLSILLEKTTK